MDNSQGLVDQYAKRIKQLAAKHQMGNDLTEIKSEVDNVLAEAKQHISIWVNGTPEENWSSLGGKLRFEGELSSSTKWKEVMMYAGEKIKNDYPSQ
ncbi:hypothetical protein [Lonsdalea quercina]|uniref:hypothetical protein n=1 Tax=Lonsdalea quercina TaxID=71657 RepID=UPI0039766EA7